MNYLAHLFLSDKNPKMMMGNFLGDLVNSKEFKQLPDDLRRGVELHRKIDTFTDNHPKVDHSVEILHPFHHKYAPVVVDIFYDYLLFKNWDNYTNESIQEFSNWAYGIINEHIEFVPERNREKVKKMVAHNWLLGYGELEHLHQTFLRVKKRARFPSQFEFATKHLIDNYETLNDDFLLFFPELIELSTDFISKN